jgi:hypothetical protein
MRRRSRLRRMVLSDRWFFISCQVLPHRRPLPASEFGDLARVIHERRSKHGSLLAAWTFPSTASCCPPIHTPGD